MLWYASSLLPLWTWNEICDNASCGLQFSVDVDVLYKFQFKVVLDESKRFVEAA